MPINITIDDNAVYANVSYFQNNQGRSKNVLLSDLIEGIKETSANKIFDTGILPQGMRFVIDYGTEQLYGVEVPPSNQIVSHSYGDGEKISCPFPGLLFFFRFGKGVLNWSKLYAIKEPILSYKTPLYLFPFTNVYDDGNICWGGVNNTRINSPLQVTSIVANFFGSVFNNDLFFDSRIKSNIDKKLSENMNNSYALMKYLEKKYKDYPANALVKSNKTIKDVIFEMEPKKK